MADNTTLQTTLATPPSGLVIATDDVAGVHFQKVKIDVGGDGATAILGNANPLPISDAGGSVTVDGTVNATLDTSTYAGFTAPLADYDSSGATQAIPMIGVAVPSVTGPVPGGTFTNPFRVDPIGATVQPVSDGAGSLTVDGAVSLAAAIPAGTNNIGDVDVLSVPAPLNVTGNGAAATALRVTVANDSTGIVAATVTGNVAHDSPVSGNPLQVAGDGRSTDPTAVSTGDVVRNLATLLGKQVFYPFALPGSTWNYAAATGGVVNTTPVTIKTAGAAGIRNYITNVQVVNTHATQATEISIRDGAVGTVLWRQNLLAAGGGFSISFDVPLRGSAATLLEIVCGTAGAAVFFNAQGFSAGE
jgi:hypothetical protein